MAAYISCSGSSSQVVSLYVYAYE
jgi:isopenicillin-N N-acyltransferase like protein